MISLAASGDVKAAQMIADRVDGKPVEAIEHTMNGMPTKIEIEFVTPNRKDGADR
jgi:hypothetical protein